MTIKTLYYQQMHKHIIRTHKYTTDKYAAITPTTSISTEKIEPLL